MNAGLDVSEVLSDPMICSTFDVIRRSEVIGQNGRVNVDAVTHGDILGVITAAGSNDLERLDDNQRTGRNISVVTSFRLRATAPGYQPDLIGWQGDFYVVKMLDPYTQYGAGFVQAIAGSLDFQDAPPSDGVEPVFPHGPADSASLETIYGDGAPISGPNGTGAGNSRKGRMYIDTTGADLYINASTDLASPDWKMIPREG